MQWMHAKQSRDKDQRERALQGVHLAPRCGLQVGEGVHAPEGA